MSFIVTLKNYPPSRRTVGASVRWSLINKPIVRDCGLSNCPILLFNQSNSIKSNITKLLGPVGISRLPWSSKLNFYLNTSQDTCSKCLLSSNCSWYSFHKWITALCLFRIKLISNILLDGDDEDNGSTKTDSRVNTVSIKNLK